MKLRLAANLSLLFTELPLSQRFAAARAAGFAAAEIQFPYDHPAEALAAAAREADLPVILINAPAGDLMQGGPGLACHPRRQHEFAAALESARHYAQQLGCEMVNILPGRCPSDCSRQQAQATLAANLDLAADFFRPHRIRVCCEAINDVDMPGFLLRTAEELAALFANCRNADLWMQIDLYHMAAMQQDIPALLTRHRHRIGHIQFADYPGRGAPGSGQLDFTQLFEKIAQSGYQGWCAAEYRPVGNTLETLDWLRRLP